MNIKSISIISLIVLLGCILGLRFKVKNGATQGSINDVRQLAQTPPMGWNSFDSYGVYLYEEAAFANLEAFAKKLKPHGYEYFVIDAGWFGEFKLQEGTLYPAEKHASELNIDEYGLLQPSKTYFPNGLRPIIDRCHELGIKFGIHLMRGIPRVAVEKNTKVKGTEYFARDIADTTSICEWNHQNYGVDMSKPGAQEFYNSLINQMAEWGVDFLKYDDLVPFPDEVEAIANAIEQCGRPIVYSLSPGGDVDVNAIKSFKRANMLRVTHDIWDDQVGLNQSFDAWRKWQGKEESGFWIDMDMIPFGKLQLMSPKPEGVVGNETKKDIAKKIESGELSNVELLAGKGWARQSKFTKDQMYTFITLRALSASPLMMGGNLPTLDDFSLELITHKDVLDCNQNGIMGKLIYEDKDVEIWKTPQKGNDGGWIGLFNRSESYKSFSISMSDLNLEEGKNKYHIYDIWNKTEVNKLNFEINQNGVIFLKYSSQ
ncbi:Melibiase [Lutibacter agarilyticus]|uniref:Alpha-galactosidase n=1 Tax=Lutibacter agarilyticus TaxID=1109740 RepID=A0A238X8V8_9FLAO|nr:glycoside hydrolase family 27 protein [Lutibacter agarilyticus]SNR54269.1 Melibiase [Lutibacter agarilyticus]